ncbi:MAG: dephospho-CoA kinase [Wenzhouxiangella sp.]
MRKESGHQRPLLVALTGGIASGKTAVSDRLAALGAAVIDTDLVAREVVEPGQAGLDKLVEAFGEDILTSERQLDRQRLAEVIFADPDQRRILENLLHPLIEARTRELIQARSDAAYVVVVVPLLVESGLFEDADRVVVVDVPEEIQLERLCKRGRISEEKAREMMASQASRQQRLQRADQVIDNSTSLSDLDRQVRQLHQDLLAANTLA